jgi:hypothetical protein
MINFLRKVIEAIYTFNPNVWLLDYELAIIRYQELRDVKN